MMLCIRLFFFINSKNMPRKYGLSVRRKYAWCKSQQQKDNCQLTVEHVPVPVEIPVCGGSVQPSLPETPTQLIVSIPHSIFLSLESASLAILRQRVIETSTLPPGKLQVCFVGF